MYRLPTRSILFSCALLLGLCATATAGQVGLTVAGLPADHVTYDQNYQGGVAGAVDGNISTNGWALQNANPALAGVFDPQAAVFTATGAPLSVSDLHFSLVHNSGFPGHNINEFRISVTSDPAPTLGSAWTSLTPTYLGVDSPTVGMSNVGDNRVRVVNNSGSNLAYEMSAAAPFGGITGYRLEVFPYDYNTYDVVPATVGRASAGNGNIVLSEFIVDDTAPPGIVVNPAEINYSLGRTTTGDTNPNGWGDPGHAVDGLTNTHSHTMNVGPVFWQVELDQPTDLTRVEMVNRVTCCGDRLEGAVLSVRDSGGTPIFTAAPIPAPAADGQTFTFDNGGAGFTGAQFIRVEHNNQYLAIAEMRAIGPAPMAAAAPANLALLRQVTTSGGTWPGFPASHVSDGNRGNWSHPAAVSTPNVGEHTGYWYLVDMGELIAFDHIDLYNRADGCCTDRLSNYLVEVLGEDGTTVNWSGTIQPTGDSGVGGVDVVTAADADPLAPNVFTGQFIRVTNVSGIDYNPQIAEIEAFGMVVPEPAGLCLLAIGIACLVGRRRPQR